MLPVIFILGVTDFFSDDSQFQIYKINVSKILIPCSHAWLESIYIHCVRGKVIIIYAAILTVVFYLINKSLRLPGSPFSSLISHNPTLFSTGNKSCKAYLSLFLKQYIYQYIYIPFIICNQH